MRVTKDIEDKLSDKLHQELTRSFIDKKISILSRGLKQDFFCIKLMKMIKSLLMISI